MLRLEFEIPGNCRYNREQRNHLSLEIGRYLRVLVGVFWGYEQEISVQAIVYIVDAEGEVRFEPARFFIKQFPNQTYIPTVVSWHPKPVAFGENRDKGEWIRAADIGMEIAGNWQ